MAVGKAKKERVMKHRKDIGRAMASMMKDRADRKFLASKAKTAQGGRCIYCGRKFTKTRKATFDHIQPVSAGGVTTALNGVAACYSCNNERGTEDYKTFLARKRPILVAMAEIDKEPHHD